MSAGSRHKKRPSLDMISEGDEFIKLQDVLSSRARCLTPDELWAVCRECCLTLKRLSAFSEMIQTLSVMLDTVAFDLQGNVCFIDHEIDDDSRYRPPEYDKIGNSTKGFIFSLGLVLYEASIYNSETYKLPQNSPQLQKLINSMMEPDHSSRINLESVLKEGDNYFKLHGLASLDICRNLIAELGHHSKVVDESDKVSTSDASANESIVSSTSQLLTTSIDMSLQDLVDKYKPHQMQIEESKTQDKEVVLSPPEQFKIQRNPSAFSPKDTTSSSLIRNESKVKSAQLSEGQLPDAQLPDAYLSSATHFSPIILSSQDKKLGSSQQGKSPQTKTERTIKELKKQLLKTHVQEGESRTSMFNSQSNHSKSNLRAEPRSASSNSAKHEETINKVEEEKTIEKKSIISSRPIPAPKPPVSQSRVPSSASVTQAVKPLPRQTVNMTVHHPGSNFSANNNMNNNNAHTHFTLPSIQMSASASNTSDAIPTTPSNHSVLISSTAIPSPALIPSVPVMLQRDAATGTVGWIPVMPNLGPYWAMSPQQATVLTNPMSSQAPVAIQMTNIHSSTHNNPMHATIPITDISTPSVTEQQQAYHTTIHITDINSPSITDQHQVVHTPTNNPVVTSENAPAQVKHGSTNSRNITEQQQAYRTPLNNPHLISENPPAPAKRKENENNRAADLPVATNGIAHQSVTGTGINNQPVTANGINNQSVTANGINNQSVTAGSNKIIGTDKFANIRQLLRNEFAFDGYMDQGQEDYDMAKFIGSLHLPSLEYSHWCNIIVAKYGDLYWSDQLLCSLYEVIHGKPPDTDRPPSGALRSKSARVLSVDEPGLQDKQERKVRHAPSNYAASPFRPIPLGESLFTPSSSTPTKSVNALVKPKAVMPVNQADKTVPDVVFAHSPLPLISSRAKSLSVQDLTKSLTGNSGTLVKSKSQTNLSRPAEGAGNMRTASMVPLVKTLALPNGGTRQVMYIEGKDVNPLYEDIWSNTHGLPGSAFEQDSDSHSHSSASELRIKGRLHSSSIAIGSNSLDDPALNSKLSSEYESDSSLATHLQQTGRVSAVCATVIYASYLANSNVTVSLLSEKSENKSVDGIKKKIADLNQQISVNSKRRNKAFKYIKKIMENGTGQAKGSIDYKAILSQVKLEHQESVREIEQLVHARLQLEVLLAEQSSIEVTCLYSLIKLKTPMIVTETNNNPYLQFQAKRDQKTNREVELLYAGHNVGLMSYLYAKGALEEGYILEFFHSFRYVLDPSMLLGFLMEKYKSAREMKPSEVRDKIMQRTIDLLLFWVSSYYTVDFYAPSTLPAILVNFLQEELLPEHQADCDALLRLVDEYENDKGKTSTFADPMPSQEDLPYVEEETKITRQWNASQLILSIGTGKSTVRYRRTRSGIVPLASPKKQVQNEGASADSFSILDYTPAEIAEQLTIIEQTLFNDVHPVNFMNSLAQGIGAALADGSSAVLPLNEKRLMFYSGYMQVVALLPMIQHSKAVSHWVTAELISSSNAKTQMSILTKFLQVAKICKDIRNFATCIAIKDGLDHILIRHIPAWKDIPAKLLQELDDVKLLHKTDPYAFKQPEDHPGLPAIPCALLFALHVQQLEQGGFSLANGMFKWPKLKSLAQLVDLIRLCKRFSYQFIENMDLKSLLTNRMSEMCSHTLETLAIAASSEGLRASGASSSKWSNMLKKVKGRRL